MEQEQGSQPSDPPEAELKPAIPSRTPGSEPTVPYDPDAKPEEGGGSVV